MTSAHDKWLADVAPMIAKIQAGNLSPLQQSAMNKMTTSWQHQEVFSHEGPANLHLLEAAGLIEHQACTIHYPYGYSPNIPLKSCPHTGTDEPGIEWRLKQA